MISEVNCPYVNRRSPIDAGFFFLFGVSSEAGRNLCARHFAIAY